MLITSLSYYQNLDDVKKNEDLEYLRNLIDDGKLRSIIDFTLPLEEMVKAHHYVESGSKKGNLVIDISQSDQQ